MAIGSGGFNGQRARMGRRAEPSNTRLYEIRSSRGLGANEVAEKAGIPLRTYMRYEKGDRGITEVYRKALASALQIDPKEFFAEKGAPIPRASEDANSSGSERGIDIDPEVIRDLLNKAENRGLLGLWLGMDEATQRTCLEVIRSISALSRLKNAS